MAKKPGPTPKQVKPRLTATTASVGEAHLHLMYSRAHKHFVAQMEERRARK